MKTIKALFTSIALTMAAISFSASAQTVTNIDLAGLQTEFNASQGFTRIIFLGDPTCGGCIASASDLRLSLFNQCGNPDLRGLVVWMHVSGFNSTFSNAVTQSSLWSDPRVSFYWDSVATDIAYHFGYMNTWSGCSYAWDMAMTYTDTATWAAAIPPPPYYCMSKAGCCNTWNILNLKNQLVSLGECFATGMTEAVSSADIYLLSNLVDDFIDLNAAGKIEVFSMMGELIIKSENAGSMDISGLPAGIYFLRVNSGNNFYSQKFVKQ